MELSELIESNINELKDRQGKRALITGIPIGFDRLDQLTNGLQKSNLITICGATGMGKRSLVYNIARNAAVEGNVKVGILNLSLSNEEASMRLLCAEARVSSSRIRSGFLSRDDWERMTMAAGTLVEFEINIHDKQQGLFDDAIWENDLILIDSFQRLPSIGSAANINQEQRSYDLANKLKDKALDKKSTIIVLSSLNDWRIEQRSDKRPRLTDFKYGYTSLPDISDIVISVYRDEVYNREDNNPNRGTAEVIINKQRCGPTGTAVLTFLNMYCRFENLASEDEI